MKIVISTKYGYDFSEVEQIGHTVNCHKDLMKTLQEKHLRDSLERLQTDYVDMYGLHNPKLKHIRDDSIFNVLDSFIADGKIKTYQVALGPAIGWTQEGLEAMERSNV